MVSKITNLLDAVLYGYGNGFNSFCNNRGVDVLVSRIEVRMCCRYDSEMLTLVIQHEVDIDLRNNEVDDSSEWSLYGALLKWLVVLYFELDANLGHLPYPRAVLLKHIMRTMHRMMQASGTTENLRGLIDSSLTRSLKKIMENRGLFGPAIFSIG